MSLGTQDVHLLFHFSVGSVTIQCRLTGTIRYNMIQYTPYCIVPVGKFVFDSNAVHITALTYTCQNNKKHNPILHITESCTYHNIIQKFYRVWYNLGLSLLKETKDNRKSRETSSFWLLKETTEQSHESRQVTAHHSPLNGINRRIQHLQIISDNVVRAVQHRKQTVYREVCQLFVCKV